ncbi:MAG: hypothetical protein HWE08_00650 [Alphaproteobacteria bacterium]|nr:hypothetical protein [Alphaproteobacteria bacterium]
MSFHEKSTAVMLGGIILVYSWYFTQMLAIAETAPVDEGVAAIATIAPLLGITIAALVGIAIVAHIVIAIVDVSRQGDVDDAKDERDELIDLKSEQRGSIALTIGALAVLTMMLTGFSMFWAANALLGAMVLSTIVKASFQLYYYRRGV